MVNRIKVGVSITSVLLWMGKLFVLAWLKTYQFNINLTINIAQFMTIMVWIEIETWFSSLTRNLMYCWLLQFIITCELLSLKTTNCICTVKITHQPSNLYLEVIHKLWSKLYIWKSFRSHYLLSWLWSGIVH